MIGESLDQFLESQNYSTAILTRSQKKEGGKFFHWDPENEIIDPEAIRGCTSIIHLAGANIADKSWTPERKKEIKESRSKSADLLFKTLKQNQHSVKTIISASATGFYGDAGEEWQTEESKSGVGFMAETCVEWEKSILKFKELGIRVVILRIGMVLSKQGGALSTMSLPVKLFLGAPIGTGKQFISWIHIDDLSKLFVHVLENESISGTYNAVSSKPIINADFYKVLAQHLKRPLWPFNVPTFLMRLMLGEKADIVLHGQKVSNKKIKEAGFKFDCEELKDALEIQQ